MLASLLMAVAIPEAFGERALLFAGSYVAIQVGRHSFLTFVGRRRGTLERERAARILTWFVAAGRALDRGRRSSRPGAHRLWLVALAIDYTAPLVLYRIPGRRRLAPDDLGGRDRPLRRALPAVHDHRARRVDRDHRRDDGRARSRRSHGHRLQPRLPRHRSDVVAVLRLRGDDRAAAPRAGAGPDPLARDGYTYLHVLMVAGVILVRGRRRARDRAPDRATCPTAEAAAVVGGPALYLLGHVLFRLRMAGSSVEAAHRGALPASLVGLLAGVVPALAVAALLVVVLVA